jgi:hypothetical protein
MANLRQFDSLWLVGTEMDRHGGTTNYQKTPAQLGNIEYLMNIPGPMVQILFNAGGAISDATTATTKNWYDGACAERSQKTSLISSAEPRSVQ